MLTDSVSQFETNDVNHIPRSLQKLISDLQKSQGKKPQRNPPLNITSVKKAKNKSTAIRKKRQLNKKRDLNVEGFEENDDSVSKHSGIQIIDQRSITDFFKTVKSNLSNFKNSNETIDIEKQNDSDIEEIVFSDEELPTTRNQRQIAKINQPNFSSRNQIQAPKLDQNNSTLRNALQIGKFNDHNSLAKFQNNEYLNLMSSGRKYNPYSNEIFDHNIGQCVQNESEKFNKTRTATAVSENWKTFNDIMTTDTNFDLPDRRKKGVISDLFYENANSKIAENAKDEMSDQTVFPTMLRNQRNTVNSSSDKSKSTSIYDFIESSKKDKEKMNNLLLQLKSVNNIISKARKEITKFCSNGK